MKTNTPEPTTSQPLNGYFSFCHPQGYRDGKWKYAREEVGPPGKLTGAGNRKVDKTARYLAYNPQVTRWLMEVARCTTWCQEREDYMEAQLTRKKLTGDTDDTKRRALRVLERMGQIEILGSGRNEGTRVKLLKHADSRVHVGSVPHVDGVYPVFFKVNPVNCVLWNTLLDNPEAFHMLWWFHYSQDLNKHTGDRTVQINLHHRRDDWHPGLTRREAVKGVQYLATHGLVRSLGEQNRNKQYLLRLEDNFDCVRVGSGLGHTIPLLGAQSAPSGGRNLHPQGGAICTLANMLETKDLTPVFQQVSPSESEILPLLPNQNLATVYDRIPSITGSGMNRNNIEAPPVSLSTEETPASVVIPFPSQESPVSLRTPPVKTPGVPLPHVDPATGLIPWVPGLLRCTNPNLVKYGFPGRSPTGSPEVPAVNLLDFLSRESSLTSVVSVLRDSPILSRKFNGGSGVLEGYELVSAEFNVRQIFNALTKWGTRLNEVIAESRENGEETPVSDINPRSLLFFLANSRDPTLEPGDTHRTCLESLMSTVDLRGRNMELENFRMAVGDSVEVPEVISVFSQLAPGGYEGSTVGNELSWYLDLIYRSPRFSGSDPCRFSAFISRLTDRFCG